MLVELSEEHIATILAALMLATKDDFMGGPTLGELANFNAIRAALSAPAPEQVFTDDYYAGYAAGMQTEREHQEALSRLAMRLSTPAPAPEQGLDMPDGAGYFAFDGKVGDSSVEKVRWLVMVRRNSIDDNLYAFRYGGLEHRVSRMFGKWTRIYMPWESPPAPAVPAMPDASDEGVG